jgi:hypothetical protein
MDPDVTLDWILRLRTRLDDAVEQGDPLDADAVYALVGLIAELDAHLCAGATPPRRWLPAHATRHFALDSAQPASNDAPPRRHVRARRRARSARGAADQLPLPFAPLAG